MVECNKNFPREGELFYFHIFSVVVSVFFILKKLIIIIIIIKYSDGENCNT